MKLRNFTSILITYSFLAVGFTGLSLYAGPHCWMAAWMDWRVLGLEKEQLTALHVVFSILFLLFSILHIILNWKVLWNYCKSKTPVKISTELILCTLFCIAAWAGTLYNIPPFHTLAQWGADLTNGWQTPYNLPPKGGHAGQSLELFCQLAGIDVEKAMEILTSKNIKAKKESKLLELARANGTTPPALYNLIKDAVISDPSKQFSPLPDFLHESEREVLGAP